MEAVLAACLSGDVTKGVLPNVFGDVFAVLGSGAWCLVFCAVPTSPKKRSFGRLWNMPQTSNLLTPLPKAAFDLAVAQMDVPKWPPWYMEPKTKTCVTLALEF